MADTTTSAAAAPASKGKESTAQWTRFPIRVRPHCNPLADEGFEYPARPQDTNWHDMYPKYFTEDNVPIVSGAEVKYLDVGCAYGGLLMTLAPQFKRIHGDSANARLLMGIEIREKVVQYTQGRIEKLRRGEEDEHMPIEKHRAAAKEDPECYERVWVIRSNAMKTLPNYFRKGQLEKISFCFPDPHFHRKNHRRRIISKQLISEYAYVLSKGGLLYTITDVKDLGDWMQKHLDESPMFERVSEEELRKVPEDALVFDYIHQSSEDAQRTREQKLDMHCAVYRRL